MNRALLFAVICAFLAPAAQATVGVKHLATVNLDSTSNSANPEYMPTITFFSNRAWAEVGAGFSHAPRPPRKPRAPPLPLRPPVAAGAQAQLVASFRDDEKRAASGRPSCVGDPPNGAAAQRGDPRW